MDPRHLLDDWDARTLLTLFEPFYYLILTPQRRVRDRCRGGVGPRSARFNARRRLYMTGVQAHRFAQSAHPAASESTAGRRKREPSYSWEERTAGLRRPGRSRQADVAVHTHHPAPDQRRGTIPA